MFGTIAVLGFQLGAGIAHAQVAPAPTGVVCLFDDDGNYYCEDDGS